MCVSERETHTVCVSAEEQLFIFHSRKMKAAKQRPTFPRKLWHGAFNTVGNRISVDSLHYCRSVQTAQRTKRKEGHDHKKGEKK